MCIGKSDRELYHRLVSATNAKLMAFEVEAIPTIRKRIQTRSDKVQKAQAKLGGKIQKMFQYVMICYKCIFYHIELQTNLDVIKERRKEMQEIVEAAEKYFQKK